MENPEIRRIFVIFVFFFVILWFLLGPLGKRSVEDGSNGLFDAVHVGEKADGCDARRAAPQRFVIVREGYSAQGQRRDFHRAPYFVETVEAERGPESPLRRRIVNRPADNEVSGAFFSQSGFSDRVRRDSDQKTVEAFFNRDGPNFASRDRRGAQVNSVRARGHGDVEPIVDQHACAVRSSAFDGLARKGAQRLRAHIFFANLNKLAAGPSRFIDRFELQSRQVVVSDFSAAEERLSIGDQIEQYPFLHCPAR